MGYRSKIGIIAQGKGANKIEIVSGRLGIEQ